MDLTRWDVVTAAESDAQKLKHLEDLNRRIINALQDRFKLQGSGNFSTTYIRIFPQWEIKAPPATAGNHFSIEFIFGSRVFTPTNQSIVAGTGCDPKALIRYMFGMTGATNVTKDELTSLSNWMNANAGGRFNVGTI